MDYGLKRWRRMRDDGVSQASSELASSQYFLAASKKSDFDWLPASRFPHSREESYSQVILSDYRPFSLS